MLDAVEGLAMQPRSLTEELHGRPEKLKIFVSSKMAGGVYVLERKHCAKSIDGSGFARAWFWERDAQAGPYSSEQVCLQQAATSDGLILILGDDLTPITGKEFDVAHRRKIPTFVFADERQPRNAETEAFFRSVQGHSVTKNFENVAELETHVTGALLQFAARSWRRTSHQAWASHQ